MPSQPALSEQSGAMQMLQMEGELTIAEIAATAVVAPVVDITEFTPPRPGAAPGG